MQHFQGAKAQFCSFNKSQSLLRDRQKLPRLTIFQVIPAGYWVKFSTSKDHVSDKPHRLRYCLCERMPAKGAASSVLLSGHGTTGWYQALNCHVISFWALTAAWCVYETGEVCAQKGFIIVISKQVRYVHKKVLSLLSLHSKNKKCAAF